MIIVTTARRRCIAGICVVHAPEDRLLDLIVRHATARQEWSHERLLELRNVYCRHHQQRADTIPHVVLVVKLGIGTRPEVHLMLLELLHGQFHATLRTPKRFRHSWQ